MGEGIGEETTARKPDPAARTAAMRSPEARAKAAASLKATLAARRIAATAELEAAIGADVRGGRWTTARRLAFLETLATTGSVTVAVREIGMGLDGAYALRDRDPVFAEAWASARDRFNDLTYARAVELALNGLDEEVTVRDGVKTTRKHSDKLLAQILAKHGVGKGPAKDAVVAARTPGKAGEDARIWIEAQLAEIAAKLEAKAAETARAAETAAAVEAVRATEAAARTGPAEVAV